MATKKAITTKTEAPKFVLTEKAYRPKAPHNVAAYDRICSKLKTGPKTVNQLWEALEYSDEEMAASKKDGALLLKQQKHHDFIGYMQRGGYIQIAK